MIVELQFGYAKMKEYIEWSNTCLAYWMAHDIDSNVNGNGI